MNLITNLSYVSTGYDSVCTIVDQLLKNVYFIPYAEIISAESLY